MWIKSHVRRGGGGAMRRAILATALVAGLGMSISACSSSGSGSSGAGATQTQSEQQILLDRSRLAVEELRGNSTMGGTVNDYLARARGVLVFPNLMKAGFFVGAGGGQGVLMV